MNKDIIEEIKRKKEFSDLPDSIILRFLEVGNFDVKETRALLRKYFGVFLTNKILKSKGDYNTQLSSHISSKNRDYSLFYKNFTNEEDFEFVLDFGSGVNGFSYPYLEKTFGKVKYISIEASGQIVNNMNSFFKKYVFDAIAIKGDLMDFDFLSNILKEIKGKKLIFLFQVIDALENFKKDSSKDFLRFILRFIEKRDLIVLSVPLNSISGKKRFFVKRKWLTDFLEEYFILEKDFEDRGERIFVVRKK